MQLCSECVNDLLMVFLEPSKELLKENNFIPIIVQLEFDSDNDVSFSEPEPFVFSDEVEKMSKLLEIGATCWFRDVCDIIMVFSGCGRKIEDWDKFQENYDTERPSLYPESMRDDYLIFTYIDLIDEDFKLMFCKYKKQNNEIVFEEPEFIKGEDVNSGLVEFIIQGWNLMNKFLSNNDDDEGLETEDDDWRE